MKVRAVPEFCSYLARPGVFNVWIAEAHHARVLQVAYWDSSDTGAAPISPIMRPCDTGLKNNDACRHLFSDGLPRWMGWRDPTAKERAMWRPCCGSCLGIGKSTFSGD